MNDTGNICLSSRDGGLFDDRVAPSIRSLRFGRSNRFGDMGNCVVLDNRDRFSSCKELSKLVKRKIHDVTKYWVCNDRTPLVYDCL